MNDRLDKILDTIDGGLQSTTEMPTSYPMDTSLCVSCCAAPPAEDSSWCEPCRARLLDESLPPPPVAGECDCLACTLAGGGVIVFAVSRDDLQVQARRQYADDPDDARVSIGQLQPPPLLQLPLKLRMQP